MDWPAWIAQACGPVFAGLLAGVIGAFTADRNRAAVVPLIQFAAGAFLGLALFNLLPEAARDIGWPASLAAAAIGWTAILLLARWAGGACPACAAAGLRPHLVISIPLLVVIAVHSCLDGLPLAGTRAHPESAGPVFIALLAHKVPEGLAIAAVLRAAGRSVASAIGLTALVESCTFVGLALGLALNLNGALLNFGLALVAGSFLYVTFFTLRTSWPTTRHAANLILTGIGVLLVLAANSAVG
jgi:ZIP family zinc transporter/zinc and cadmium transporter